MTSNAILHCNIIELWEFRASRQWPHGKYFLEVKCHSDKDRDQFLALRKVVELDRDNGY
jgi:hypothetical protein